METEQLSTDWKMGQVEITQEAKDFLEFNENKHTIYPNLRDTVK